jgi:hypothetical protein
LAKQMLCRNPGALATAEPLKRQRLFATGNFASGHLIQLILRMFEAILGVKVDLISWA